MIDRRLVAVAAVCVAMGLIASSAGAAPAPWNQDRVAGISEKLADAVRDLRFHVVDDPVEPPAELRRIYSTALRDLSLLARETRHLAQKLGAGKGHDESLPTFQRIQRLRQSAEKKAQVLEIPNDTLAKIWAAEDLMIQLTPYFHPNFRDEWYVRRGLF